MAETLPKAEPLPIVEPPEAARRATPERRTPLALSYRGFKATPTAREYTVTARAGVRDERLFVISIEHGVFARGEARFQDAPDLCYAKLLRELEKNPDLEPGSNLVISAEELSEYREQHRPPGQRRS